MIDPADVTDTPVQVLERTKSSPKGLTDAEVTKRHLQYGANTLSQEKKQNVILEFFLLFTNPLNLILLCVISISFFLGETVNALLVFAMVIMGAGLNFFQEHRANLAAQQLKRRVALKTAVIRNGKETEILSRDVVPGDLIILNAGDLIPADARTIQAKDLFVNQSVLTGESFPVEKTSEALEEADMELAAMGNIVFAGTSVVTGSAHAVVVKTGKDTEFGQIAQKVSEGDSSNEFTRGIREFSVMILRIILLFVLFIFFVGAIIHHDVLQALTFSIAIAVGLTPEFLPMIMTVNMSKGSQNMAKKGVIVKKLTAIPTFGSMEILCTDKTGTLTENRITLVKYLDEDGNSSEEVFLAAYLNSIYQTGITNPMDEAVMEYKKMDISMYKKIDEIPFDFERKRMSVVVELENQHFLITKGAPDEVLDVCSVYGKNGNMIPLTDRAREKFRMLYHSQSKEGFRVLAVARKKILTHRDVYTKTDEKDLEIVGLVAFLDPPKPGVKAAIDDLEAMGVEVKVITGDNEHVSQKICTATDIPMKGIMIGHDMEHLTDEALYKKAIDTTIFARFSPTQKERIIKVLRSHGKVVGYMGDGINDSPSLKAADVGISVENGVDIAKASAHIILTNKSLQELKIAVVEGRKTFGNTMKYILMGLSSNFGNMFSVLGAVIFLPFLPMLPIQILLNNFLYDLSQVTIPADNVDSEYIRSPKRWSNKYIQNFMVIFGPLSSIYDYLSFVVLYAFFKNAPGSFQTGWFMESLATQTLVIHIIRTRRLPFIESIASPYLLISTIGVMMLGWFIPFTPLGFYFGFHPLSGSVVLSILSIVILYLVTVEIAKRFFYRRFLN